MALNFRQRITYKQYKTLHYIDTLNDVTNNYLLGDQ